MNNQITLPKKRWKTVMVGDREYTVHLFDSGLHDVCAFYKRKTDTFGTFRRVEIGGPAWTRAVAAALQQ